MLKETQNQNCWPFNNHNYQIQVKYFWKWQRFCEQINEIKTSNEIETTNNIKMPEADKIKGIRTRTAHASVIQK